MRAACCRYTYSFYLTMALPLVPVAVGCAFTALAWAWSSVPMLRSAVPMLRGSTAILNRRLLLGFMCEDAAQVHEYSLSWLEFAVPFLNLNYNSLCTKCFDTFGCYPLRDGTKFLAVAPYIACWDTLEHRSMIAASIIGIVAYVVGIPAYVFATLQYAMPSCGLGATPDRLIGRDGRYAQSKDKFKDARHLQVLGFLYTRFGNVRLPSFRRGPSYLALVGFFVGARRAGLLLVGVGVPLEALCFQPNLIRLQRRFPCASSIPSGLWPCNRSAPSLPPFASISLAFVNSDPHGQGSDWIFI